MKNINNFTQWKKWISRCDVRARDHAPKEPRAVWAQSGRSTRSAVDIFNTLRVFTKEPIREQEIKLECMNSYQWLSSFSFFPSFFFFFFLIFYLFSFFFKIKDLSHFQWKSAHAPKKELPKDFL